MASGVRLDIGNLTKQYRAHDHDVTALEDIDLSVAPGEFVGIVGKRGCGKSTLLRLLAGLEDDYRGTILVDGRPVGAGRLGHALVTGEPGLFSWLTVEENVRLVQPGPEDEAGVRAAIDLAGLADAASDYACRLPAALAVRAAIARALAGGAGVLLLDDPFGALDAQACTALREVLQRIRDEAGVTIVLATHDIEQAVHLADRIVVMQPRPGRIRRIVDVPLGHPRDRGHAGFHAVAAAVLDDLRDGPRPALTACR